MMIRHVGREILQAVQVILYKLLGNVLLIKCLPCFFLHQRLGDSSQLIYVYILFRIPIYHFKILT